MPAKRIDGRRPDQLRPVTIATGVNRYAAGSALIKMGNTHVLCTASIETSVPKWRDSLGIGWVTAEYDMLPASTSTRRNRDRGGKIDGRTQEIQRLIGRALRSVVDFAAMGKNTVWLDCDVLQADGGTRTAAITGAFVALAQAHAAGRKKGLWAGSFIREPVAAVSAGIVDGTILLDLAYEEDSRAEVDFNVVMTASGKLVELQGTAEAAPFERKDLTRILDLTAGGMKKLFSLQKRALRGPTKSPSR
jgi:ribonuclease PH